MTRDWLSIFLGTAGFVLLLIAVLILAVADNHGRYETTRLGQLDWANAAARTVNPAPTNPAPEPNSFPPQSASPGSDSPSATDVAAAPPTAVVASADLIQGGDVQRGRAIFFENAQVNCSKCHAIRGQGGNIGPDLSEIGSQRTREELLQSLQNPDAVISEGYHTLMVATIDGLTLFGVVREDSPQHVRLVDVEGREHTILVEDIDERRPGRSAMPGDVSQSLAAPQIRDLIEFLSSCREAR